MCNFQVVTTSYLPPSHVKGQSEVHNIKRQSRGTETMLNSLSLTHAHKTERIVIITKYEFSWYQDKRHKVHTPKYPAERNAFLTNYKLINSEIQTTLKWIIGHIIYKIQSTKKSSAATSMDQRIKI
jgi:hypothetical protein